MTAKRKRNTKKKKTTPKSPAEREARRNMVLSMLNELRTVRDIFRVTCATFGVNASTVRRDLRWACDQIDRDLGAAAKGSPVRTFHHLDAIAEMASHAGAAAPLMSPDGSPLMGRDPDTGEEFPVLVADAKLLQTAIKARQAQMAVMGWRDSMRWKSSLQHQQVELGKAKIELAQEQLRIAVRDREIDEERKALLAAKTRHGGVQVLQEPDQQVLNRMSRYLITGKMELEGWLLSHSQEDGDDVSDDAEGDVLGGGPEHPGVPGGAGPVCDPGE